MLDPTVGAQKWQTNFSGSGQAIKAGVQAVQVAPGQAAAAAGSKWQAKLADPATLAKYQANVSKVSLADWQNAMLTTGLSRIASGAAKGSAKYSAFASKFYPFLANVKSTISKMPSTTLQDNINRMVAQVEAVSKYKNTQ